MKVLCIGDIYGKTGRDAIKSIMPKIMMNHNPDWVIANGENVTSGNGLSIKHLNFLIENHIDIVTSGNHIFSRLDWKDVLKEKNVLKPHNLGEDNNIGSGCKIFHKEGKKDIAVINLAGRIFMESSRCPFATFDELYETLPHDIPIIVDFHGEATSEKLAFFYYVNKRATLAYGTHTHVQTSDETILDGCRTAYITDIGMTGAVDGIIGVDKSTVITRFLTGYSEKFLCANGKGKLEGVIVTIDEETLNVKDIKRVRIFDS